MPENTIIMKNDRSSNFELLRIISILGVILLHYNNPLIGGAISSSVGVNTYVLYYLESLCAAAVNLFILLNGYFMFENNKRTLSKPLKLLIQTIIFSCLAYLFRFILEGETFSIRSLVRSFVPANYFVILYIALYFISFYYNLVIRNLTIKQMKTMVITLVIIFSIYPTLVDFSGEILGIEWRGLSTISMYGSQYGYSIVNFSLMYIIGAYIKKKEQFVKTSVQNCKVKLIVSIIFCALIILIWAKVNDITGFFTERSAWEYCNTIIIFEAVLIFKLFKSINLKTSKIINELAKGAFTVFLFQNVLITHLHIAEFVKGNLFIMLLHILISTTGVYLICWLLYKVYESVTAPLFKMLIKKIPILDRDLFYDAENVR